MTDPVPSLIDPAGTAALQPDPAKGEMLATFAAGCFWGVEHSFRQTEGVIEAESGYINGSTDHPTYRQVCNGDTGHAEAVRVLFDSSKISFAELTRKFFSMHNPTEMNRQGPDIGTQYRSGIYFHTTEQREQAETIKAELQAEWDRTQQRGGRKIVTEVAEAGPFWRAEDYHQRYIEKNPNVACHVV